MKLVIREQNLSAVKNRIAEEAVRLIHDGDTVFMDGSSTVLCMVNYLKERQNMTVITNQVITESMEATCSLPSSARSMISSSSSSVG